MKHSALFSPPRVSKLGLFVVKRRSRLTRESFVLETSMVEVTVYQSVRIPGVSSWEF